MPLNTQPLSAKRQALLFCVLLLFFMGSLGFAQWLVTKHHTRLALSVWIPQEFSTAVKEPIRGLYAARAGMVDGEPRKLYYFFYNFNPAGDNESVRAEARQLYAEISVENPETEGYAVLGGRPAVEEEGVLAGKKGFAILRFTVVADRAVGILYSGTTAATDADDKLLAQLAGKLRVRELAQTGARNETRGIR